MITDACKYHGRKVEALLKRGARARERERFVFSIRRVLHDRCNRWCIGARLVPFAKIKKKERKKKQAWSCLRLFFSL